MISILDKIFKSPARVMLLYPPEVTDDNIQILHITKNLEKSSDDANIEIRSFPLNNKNNIKKDVIQISNAEFFDNKDIREYGLSLYKDISFFTEHVSVNGYLKDDQILKLKSILFKHNFFIGKEHYWEQSYSYIRKIEKVRFIEIYNVADFISAIHFKTNDSDYGFEQKLEIFGLEFQISKRNHSRSWGGDHSVDYRTNYIVKKMDDHGLIDNEKDKVFNSNDYNGEDFFGDIFRYFFNNKKYFIYSDSDMYLLRLFYKKGVFPKDTYLYSLYDASVIKENEDMGSNLPF